MVWRSLKTSCALASSMRIVVGSQPERERCGQHATAALAGPCNKAGSGTGFSYVGKLLFAASLLLAITHDFWKLNCFWGSSLNGRGLHPAGPVFFCFWCLLRVSQGIPGAGTALSNLGIDLGLRLRWLITGVFNRSIESAQRVLR